MLEIFLATKNNGKIEEIKEYLKKSKFKVISLNDFPNFPTTKEDGKNYKENAIKKAIEGFNYTKKVCLADDSGLEIDFLNGEPGLYSSRWGKTDEEKIDKVLRLMKGVPRDKRCAKFVCVLVLVLPNGKQYIIKEECKGEISFVPKGKYGFGYNPIFFVPEYNKTFAELGSEVKNQISHRGKALRKMTKILEEISMQQL
ncbi:MAG: XTP/dITP diphosphatase [Candidatus Caldatribacteriota bacterium]|nr:XTP/dITP diphosphatase [Candidatus Caldatribacteriota bacterium]